MSGTSEPVRDELCQSIQAVLWDADGVLQDTPVHTWDLAVSVVSQVPGAITGAPIDEARIRAVAATLGLDARIDDVLSVWSTFDVLEHTLEIVAAVRATGTPCYLATNQDAYRAALMRERAPYGRLLDGAYYSCDIGTAKPAGTFFERVASDLGLSPQQLLFIDDSAANVVGARSAGLNAETWTHTDGIDRLRFILGGHGFRLD